MNNATAAVFIQYGALGIITLLALLAVRYLFQQVQADKKRETDRADRNEAALRELNEAVQDKIIPAALEMVNTTKQLIDLMAQERVQRRRRATDE